MKTKLNIILVTLLLIVTTSVSAQQVNALYFLENAPMRHAINPAFQPKNRFYITLPVVGYTSMWLGTNNWTMSDFVFQGPEGNTITPLHPDAPDNWLSKRPQKFALNADVYANVLGLGFRIKDNSYLHFNVAQHLMAGASVSSSIFQLNDLSAGCIGPLYMGVKAVSYTDFGVGFSHIINNKWTVGGKVKVLVGQVDLGIDINNVMLNTSLEELHLTGLGSLHAAAPLNWNALPQDPALLSDLILTDLVDKYYHSTAEAIKEAIKPSGMGAAIDVGFTYKPIKYLQINASVTDLGFIRWNRSASASVAIDTTFTGVDIDYADYGTVNSFDSDKLLNDLTGQMNGYANAVNVSNISTDFQYTNMITANLNIGIEGHFWKDRVGVGVYSHTRFYNTHVTEEVTLGAAFRPVNWFNLAATYSLINGRGSNIGAAISLAPYDGLMFTLATDYIPLSYATLTTETGNISLPYKTPGVNLSAGVAIVVGTNYKKKLKCACND